MTLYEELNEIRRRAGLQEQIDSSILNEIEITPVHRNIATETGYSYRKKYTLSSILEDGRIINRYKNLIFVYYTPDRYEQKAFFAFAEHPKGEYVLIHSLDGYLDHNYFEINISSSHPKYRGFGIPLLNYLSGIKMRGIRGVISSEQWSMGSYTVWKSIIQSNQVYVYAINEDNSSIKEPVYVEDNTIVTEDGTPLVPDGYIGFKGLGPDDEDDDEHYDDEDIYSLSRYTRLLATKHR